MVAKDKRCVSTMYVTLKLQGISKTVFLCNPGHLPPSTGREFNSRKRPMVSFSTNEVNVFLWFQLFINSIALCEQTSVSNHQRYFLRVCK